MPTQLHRIQFVVSIENENLPNNDTDSITETVKENINETVVDTNPDINLQVTENIQNLWFIQQYIQMRMTTNF